MREIIFRGKDHFTGEWIEGYYSKVGFGNGFFDAIVKFDGGSTQPHRVDTETIGQFTGLLDKDGVKVFEGDLVYVPYNYIGNITTAWETGGGRWNISHYRIPRLSVIGNIHEQKN